MSGCMHGRPHEIDVLRRGCVQKVERCHNSTIIYKQPSPVAFRDDMARIFCFQSFSHLVKYLRVGCFTCGIIATRVDYISICRTSSVELGDCFPGDIEDCALVEHVRFVLHPHVEHGNDKSKYQYEHGASYDRPHRSNAQLDWSKVLLMLEAQ